MIYILGLILSLLLSAFMSSFEMVYVRSAPFFDSGRFDDILHDRTGVLVTVLFWNTVALVFGSISLYFLLKPFPGAIVWSGILAAILFALAGDFLPKLAAVYRRETLFRIELYPFIVFYYISYLVLIIPLSRLVLRSKYSREEVVDVIMSYLRGKVNEEDLRFAKRAISSLYEPASSYLVKGEADFKYEGDDPKVLDVLSFMRVKRCNRVELKGGVFDLHEYIKSLLRGG